jgi:predicted small lipoprotein YifL
MRLPFPALLGLLILASSAGCDRPKPQATPGDVAAAQAQAQKEVEAARAEATKDVKSAVKIAGSQSHDVTIAKATGSFDIAMAQADGDHQVALKKCLLLAVSAQPACKDQADLDYQTLVAAAKENRASHQR